MDDNQSAQCYSLVITKENGERTYGYCRRVIPEGSKQCLPLVYCILSKYRAPSFYRKLLKEIESRHGFPDKVLNNILREIYNKKFPAAGNSIKIDVSKCFFENNEIKTESNNLDLNSFVVVGKNGEYGTLNRLHVPNLNGNCYCH